MQSAECMALASAIHCIPLAELLGSLDKNTIDKEEELLSLCKLGNEKKDYEDILKKRIKKKEEKKDIQDYCYFLYQESRFEDLLEMLKKYKSKNIEIPYCFKQYVDRDRKSVV